MQNNTIFYIPTEKKKKKKSILLTIFTFLSFIFIYPIKAW